MTDITFTLNEAAGLTGITLEVLDARKRQMTGTIVPATETSSGVFEATVSEDLVGTFYILDIMHNGTGIEKLGYRPNRSSSVASITNATAGDSDGGYELTGGFADRTTGTAGASDVGSNVSYTQTMVNASRWMRLGFDSTQQETNDSAYWASPAPSPTDGIGLFGGSYMPAGVDSMFDYSFNSAGYSNAVESGDFQYTAADGSYDFTGCRPGDLALVRFDFNVLPQIANTTLEVGLIWQTRDENDVETFTFALTGSAIFFGTGTVGKTFLQRPLISAYFASDEDVNARALPAIRADNPVQIQPLTTLSTIIR
ncbi:MAG: hypothetical protein GY753_10800 [Gammaproteobacteria bacterium]|nr:hypothetical protein [Gammaproteobacteria bacterium]